MTNDEILQHLWQSGIDAEIVGDQFYVSSQGCFINSAFDFLGEFQILLYIVAAFMMAGWAFALIRGAQTNIVNNLRNLAIVFAVLSIIRPLMIVFYGTANHFEDIACRRLKVGADDIKRVVRLSGDIRLPDGFIESAMTAGEIPEVRAHVAEVAEEITEEPQIARPPSRRPTNRLRPTSVRTRPGVRRQVVDIENIPLWNNGQGGVAQDVIRRFNIAIREAHWGGGDGHIGARRGLGYRDHAGTDIMPGGRPPAPGTQMPAFWDGRVIRISRVYANDPSLSQVVIQNDNGSQSRVLYVRARDGLMVGDRVAAGEVIGYTQDVRPHYGNHVAQHVHFELYYGGNLIDTESLYE
ncbi:MAG: M23 family metallopeptidase, partial [Rickettsiales bacterium]|nr:M23 family metallopeptidase [Rickettsiales bacterium]